MKISALLYSIAILSVPLFAGIANAADGSVADLVASAPQGGPELEKTLAGQLVADPALASSLGPLVANADVELKKSLGRSFGLAVATLSVTPDSTSADPILQVVATITDVDFLAAFADATGQLSTAAIGGPSGPLFGGDSPAAALAPTVPQGSSGPNTAGPAGLNDPVPNGVSTPNFTGLNASISPIRPS